MINMQSNKHISGYGVIKQPPYPKIHGALTNHNSKANFFFEDKSVLPSTTNHLKNHATY